MKISALKLNNGRNLLNFLGILGNFQRMSFPITELAFKIFKCNLLVS